MRLLLRSLLSSSFLVLLRSFFWFIFHLCLFDGVCFQYSQVLVSLVFSEHSDFFLIGLAVRVFANGPGDLGSIPGRVIPKTQKIVLDASLLNTQHYKVRIKGKVESSREGVAPCPTPWCSSYRKGSLRVTLDYGRQLYFTIPSVICHFPLIIIRMVHFSLPNSIPIFWQYILRL